jgi:hypothetical protein
MLVLDFTDKKYVPSFSLINKIFADVEEKGKNFFSENHLWHLGGL